MGDISPRGLALIKDYESYSGEAYLCPEGVPTIGWGSIRWDAKTPVKLGDKCTVDQAEQLLRKEVGRIEDAIDAYVTVPLTQGQFDCICSWAYNVGIGWITGKREGGAATLIRYLNKGQYDKVPSELLKFRKGAVSGKVIGGLINRRKREIQELWFHEDEAPSLPAPTPMPQAVEPVRDSVGQTVKDSVIVKLAGGGLAATIGKAIMDTYDWLFSVAKEAGPEVLSLKTTIGPFEPLIKASPAILSVVVAVVLGAVIIRRIQTR